MVKAPRSPRRQRRSWVVGFRLAVGEVCIKIELMSGKVFI